VQALRFAETIALNRRTRVAESAPGVGKSVEKSVELIGRAYFVKLRYGAAPNSSIQQHR
jgi:hypothetical protein